MSDVGEFIFCEVTATNAFGVGVADSDAIGPITAIPINVELPVVTGTLAVGDTLTCSTGDWTGSATITYTYQWLQALLDDDDVVLTDDDDRPIGDPIVGETGSTYDLAPGDEDEWIFCEVTATNGFGSTMVVSDAVGPVTSATFTANAVAVDGSTYAVAQALAGVSNGKVGLVSIWLKMHAGTDDDYQEFLNHDDYDFTLLRDGFANGFQLSGTNAAHDEILRMKSAGHVCEEASGWVHFMAWWDLNSSVGGCYINDVLSTQGDDILTNDTIGYVHNTSNYTLFTRSDVVLNADADVAELYVNFAETLDLSIEANRRQFIDEFGKPVNLGTDGSNPTGNAPAIFLSGATASWHTNKGTSGGFTLTAGSLTTATTSPSD